MLFREVGECYVKPEECHSEFQFLLTYTKMLEGVFTLFSQTTTYSLRFRP